jgi:threonine/homoserine/homoserine lactone efflux protein
LLNTVSAAFEWLCWAGAIYLVYLGIKTWHGAGAPLVLDARPASRANLFVQGLVITVPNPKSLIFIAAFLPQFIDSTHPLGSQLAVIIPTFLVITFTVTSVWAWVAGKARGFLQSQRRTRAVLRGAGGLMVVAGLGLAWVRLA